jgi:hypothetical protein
MTEERVKRVHVTASAPYLEGKTPPSANSRGAYGFRRCQLAASPRVRRRSLVVGERAQCRVRCASYDVVSNAHTALRSETLGSRPCVMRSSYRANVRCYGEHVDISLGQARNVKASEPPVSGQRRSTATLYVCMDERKYRESPKPEVPCHETCGRRRTRTPIPASSFSRYLIVLPTSEDARLWRPQRQWRCCLAGLCRHNAMAAEGEL